MTLKELQKFHSDAKLYYGNRVGNPTEKVQKILINPATPEGKIVWIVNGPEYKDDEIVAGALITRGGDVVADRVRARLDLEAAT
jgi:hypothetical protein